ncbi:DUF5707 domain-containing protein [Streptomyces sp. NPDC088729]|uniref:DUF5707 domain-containing protein n=1 Tax=Streptomyces sp. NPDC088729 TaxID=3365876 RepID=UPI0038265F0B
MSQRLALSALAAVALLGGAGTYAFAGEAPRTGPKVTDGTAVYVAPSAGKAGSLTFTARVSDDSGVRGLKVIAWPASMSPAPTAKEMADVDSAVCKAAGDGVARCAYTLKVTRAEAAELPKGTWRVTALATANDGGTAFVPKAAEFTVNG